MIIGTSETDLPPGDYAMDVFIDPALQETLGHVECKIARFRKIPEGVIRPGMDATQILTSGIDLSDEGIERALEWNRDRSVKD